jgi:hypothetical protein
MNTKRYALSKRVSGNDLSIAVRVTEFWRLVDTSAGECECWPWLGYTEDGYGQFHWLGRMVGAHELALTFATGEVRLHSLDTCHSCHNPSCCNPGHLRFDTRLSNVRDMDAARRRVNANTKLTDGLVREMRERRANGASQKYLAEYYGVSDGSVSMIIRGIRWPHAGGPIENERQYNRG